MRRRRFIVTFNEPFRLPALRALDDVGQIVVQAIEFGILIADPVDDRQAAFLDLTDRVGIIVDPVLRPIELTDRVLIIVPEEM